MSIKKRQIVSVVMAFLLMFSAFSFTGGSAFASDNLERPDRQVDHPDRDEPVEGVPEDALDVFADDERVRVIVEVEEASGVTYAIQQGVKYSELPEATQEQLEQNAIEAQQQVISEIDRANVTINYLERFTTVTNGFSAEVPFGQIERLEQLRGVADVQIVNEYERPEEEPEMVSSKEMIRAGSAWDDFGHDGEGMVIGIIDTGVDPAHQDMILSDGTEQAIDEELIEGLNVPGGWFTDKVPYGYNYIDHSDEILDLAPGASHHGMHVAGTAAANGDEEDGGLKGVAPEAQLLALKVFSNDPLISTTYGDIYVKAMDDALKMGVDVLNLSLGSVAGFVNPDAHEQKAVQRAKDSGVVVSISAGNSAHFGNGFSNPFASNPDIGVTGSPSVSPASTGVASIENDFIQMDIFSYESDSVSGSIPYLVAQNDPADILDEELDVVFANYGGPSRDNDDYPVDDFEDLDVDGKIVLVSRGEIPFVDKALNAQEAGAAGIIVHNNTGGYINMATDGAIDIPYLAITQSHGHEIRDLLDDGETVTVAFEGESELGVNPEQGSLSSFTSWGLAPNLDFKPEITAPGGNILSTLQDNEYGLMSGTSMAAPHVAGGAGLILNRVDEDFGLSGPERSKMAKNLLLNTAVPATDLGLVNEAMEWDNAYSPRRQGAGLMDLHAASATPAYVTSPADNDEAKVALRDFDNATSFQLDVTNVSDEAVHYDLDLALQTDFEEGGFLGFDDHALEATEILEADFTALHGGEEVSSVTVDAGDTITLDFELDVSDAAVLDVFTGELVSLEDTFVNGYFAEGFVSLIDPADVNPPLSIPFVGFNGDWGALPVFDSADSDESFYGYTGLLEETDGAYYFLDPVPHLDDAYVFSPELTDVTPILSLLRNAKEAEFRILDENEEPLRTIRTESNLRKHFFDGGSANPYGIYSAASWDGTISRQAAEDGLYYYEVRGHADYPEADWQSLTLPVVLDATAPEADMAIHPAEETVSWEAYDETSGVSHSEVYVEDELVETVPASESGEYDVSLSNVSEGDIVDIHVYDYAGNSVELSEEWPSMGEPAHIYIYSPELLAFYTEHDIPVEGYIDSGTPIETFTVHGQTIDLELDEETGHYHFDSTFSVEEDDVYAVDFVATNEYGLESKLNRRIFVDTTPPEIADIEAPEAVTTGSFDLSVTLRDNFDGVRFYIDDSEVYKHDLEMPYEKRAFEKEFTTTLPLNPGQNTFELRLVDEAGHETVEEIEVYRDIMDRLYGDDRFETSAAISQAGWDEADTVVIANGNQFADALAGAPLAYQLDAPILLTAANTITDAVLEEIDRLGASEAVILGGTPAVSEAVEDILEEKELSIERIAGDTRFETAEAIADELAKHTDFDKVVVVNGWQYDEAISTASFAAQEGLPIFLTEADSIRSSTLTALENYGVDETLVIGDTDTISDDVLNELPAPERIYGSDHYETNLALFDYFDPDADVLYVATGENFPDALAGSVLAAKNNTGIALVSDSISDALESYLLESEFASVRILGGTDAVNEDVEEALRDITRSWLD